MKDKILAFWQQRNYAERRTIMIAGTLLMTALLYVFIWHPLTQEQQRLRTVLPQIRATTAQMHHQATAINHLRNVPQKNFNANIREALEKAAVISALGSPFQQTLLDNRHAKITINAIAFDRWIEWINILQSEQGVRIESAEIVTLTEPGIVKIQATLSSPASR